MECRHVAHNALQRTGNGHLCHGQIRENSVRIPRFFVPIVLRMTLDTDCLAAFVRIRIRHLLAGIQIYLCIQPAITMRRILQMVFLEQHNCRHQRFFPLRRLGKMRFPVVEAASLDTHHLAQQLDREHAGQFQDYLLLLLSKGANSF